MRKSILTKNVGIGCIKMVCTAEYPGEYQSGGGDGVGVCGGGGGDYDSIYILFIFFIKDTGTVYRILLFGTL